MSIESPPLKACIVSKTESGEISIGKTAVPIVKPQTLQGGFDEEESGALQFVGAANGETLSKTPQKVPGGLLDLVKCNEIKGEGFFEKLERGACELVFENKTNGVNATTELAAPASSIGLNENNLFLQSGTGVSLPVKIKMENSLLGSECYIGSNSNPITINLTTGTRRLPERQTRGTRRKGGRRRPGDQKQHASQQHLLGADCDGLRRVLLVPD